MKSRTLLLASIVVACLSGVLLFCAKKSPTSIEEKDFSGTISGYVYSGLTHAPLSGVSVYINADSATPATSGIDGSFEIGRVSAGTHRIHFSHRDYDEDSSAMVTLAIGEQKKLSDTARLTFGYYTLKGRVVENGSAPEVGAGVVCANTARSSMTDEAGYFIIERLPKTSGDLKLICAKTGSGFCVVTPIRGVVNDTTVVPDITLNRTGGTVTGTVFDSLGHPVAGAAVQAVGNGLRDTTDSDGLYRIEDVPTNESDVSITVSINGTSSTITGMSVSSGATLSGMDLRLRQPSGSGSGMTIVANDVITRDTARTVTLYAFATPDSATRITKYDWFLTGGATPDTSSSVNSITFPASKLPGTPAKRSFLSKRSVAGSADIQVRVRAVNQRGEFSPEQAFYIRIRSVSPRISAKVSASADSAGRDSATIELNQPAFFMGDVTAAFGGIDTMEWNFGDGSGPWTTTDSVVDLGHIYDTAGIFNAVFRVRDIGGTNVRDTVTVTVQRPAIPAPLYVSPARGDTIRTAADSVRLVWRAVSGAGVQYNVYISSLNTIPGTADKIIALTTDTSAMVAIVKGRRYYWKVEAVSAGVKAAGAVWNFTAVNGSPANRAPVFTSRVADMLAAGYTGRLYRDTLHATDADGDSLNFTFVEFPAGMTLTDSIVSWIPGATEAGAFNVEVSVSDGDSSRTLAWTVTVAQVPVIQRNPVAVTVVAGQQFTLSVGATGDSLRFKWQKDGGTVSGATDSIYRIIQSAASHAGLYRCIAYNSVASDTSDTARVTVTAFVAPVVYVKADADTGGDGSTWARAFRDVQQGINRATRGSQVWVAAGTYRPDTTGKGRNASYSMKDGVEIYGGFVGTETALAQRNWQVNATMLSGDIGTVGDATDNCIHVINNTAALGLTLSALLDGFVVRGGNAGTYAGGGMNNDAAWPVVRNCVFDSNTSYNGGAIYNFGGSRVRVENTVFRNNNSSYIYGGAVYCTGSNATFFGCTFDFNRVESIPGFGGGLYAEASTIIMDRCSFTNNQAYSGGAIALKNSAGSLIRACTFSNNQGSGAAGAIDLSTCGGEIIGCTFHSNRAPGVTGGAICMTSCRTLVAGCTFYNNMAANGGAVFIQSGTPALVNCTMSGNQSTTDGGAVYMFNYSKVRIVNNILWDNQNGGNFNDLLIGSGDSLYLLNNTLHNRLAPSSNIIDSGTIILDPLLIGLAANGGEVLTSALGVSSPALNAGVYVFVDTDGTLCYNTDGGTTYKRVETGAAYTPTGTMTRVNATDARGVTRPQGAGIDLGAYEKE